MITLLRSLNSIFLLATILSFNSHAESGVPTCPAEFEVLERHPGNGSQYGFVKKTLDDLYCTNSFEGKYFKIVYSTEGEAIPFSYANKEVLKKAANVYYHLTRARNYWIKEIKSQYVSELPQTIVRIDITNGYSSTRHFKHAEQEKNENNAWSVPNGQTPENVTEKEKWGKEIWFSPMRKIESKKFMKDSKGQNPIHQSLLLVNDPIIEYNKNALIYQALSFLIVPDITNTALLNLALQRVGTIAVIMSLTEGSKYIDGWFVKKYYYVDTAMIPEIIYHEFSHIAMSDTMKPVHSIPVIEGMADYFAALIAERRDMYEAIKEFSSNKTKKTDNKSLYHPYLEGQWNATSDFTLSLLWKGKTEFERINRERWKKGQQAVGNYDNLVFDAHFLLNESSNISTDLAKSLINVCHKKCLGSRMGIDTLHNVFEKKGLN